MVSSSTPFMFDVNDFDDPFAAGGDDKPRPIYTQDEMDAAVQNAHAQGAQDGQTLAMQSLEQQLAILLPRVAERAGDLIARSAADQAAARQAALQMALTLANKMIPSLAQRDNVADIESFLHRVLAERFDEPRLVLRVHTSVLDALRDRLDSFVAQHNITGKLVLMGEPSLAVADCRVEWADGGAERDVTRLQNDMDGLVRGFIASLGMGSAFEETTFAHHPSSPDDEIQNTIETETDNV